MQTRPIWMQKTPSFHSSLKDTAEADLQGADHLLQSLDKHPDLPLDCTLGEA